MAISELKLFRTRLQSLKTTLNTADRKAKEGFVGLSVAIDALALFEEVGEKYPDLKDSLPSPPRLVGPQRHMGKAPLSFSTLN